MIATPRGLTKASQGLWKRSLAQLRAQGDWDDGLAPLLERYVRAMERARLSQAAATTQPFIEGSQGQVVAHPGLRIAAAADRDAQEYAKQLGLVPDTTRRGDDDGDRDPAGDVGGAFE